MKKIICALMSVLLMGSVSFAQTNTAKNSKPSVSATTNSKANTAKGTTAQSQPGTATTKAPRMKADGTPDMRHAENKKAAVAPTQKLKKDGTPDMRYKENKKTPAATPTATATKK